MAAIDKSGGYALTIREAAAACRVSPRTIRRHLNAGDFPSAYEITAPDTPGGTMWKIPVEDLDRAGLDPKPIHPTTHGSGARSESNGDGAPSVLELVRSDRFGRLRSELAEAVAAAELSLLRAEIERWRLLAEERGQALERADLAIKALTTAIGENGHSDHRDVRPHYSDAVAVPSSVRDDAMRYTATMQAMRALHTQQQRHWWQFWRS